ncbi:SUMO-specific isopeptidase USPL1 [Crotalus adamanteus]|uniref:SUMO-specific isopeptidase USPL1 n=1 Tax=Crotalus adamanteus TaxID=8729 RepID=A0AAW1BLX9_CROAD
MVWLSWAKRVETKKNLNSAEVTPDGYCPACKKIGLMRRIRKYHINFEESMFLCENPQCIYPLGSASLSTIIIPSDAKVIQSLLTKYNEAAVVVNTCQRDELTSEVPLDVLSRAETHLNEIRNTVYVQLQPLLGCKLGEEESPVFAFPLLLREDRHIENLFLHSFSWKFECLQCGYHTNNSCQRTMTTFTNIIPEWHPLNAVHVAPCNKCNHTSQRRKMVLEKISSVLMMHFVEGLPHNNLMAYSFQFQEYSYQVTAVVQYQKAQHFITWILTSDGIWLESMVKL